MKNSFANFYARYFKRNHPLKKIQKPVARIFRRQPPMSESSFAMAGSCSPQCVMINYNGDLSSIGALISKEEARKIYEQPGIIALSNALPSELLPILQAQISDKRRYFKDAFNQGLDESAKEFQAAYSRATSIIAEISRELFGYNLTDCNSSFRPMLTVDEPIHYDTYHVPCGKTSLMAVVNFDELDRIWHVGPCLEQSILSYGSYFEKQAKAAKSASALMVTVRTDGVNGNGPLGSLQNYNRIGFATNTVWFANPKTISHQIMYGGGAFFMQWLVDEPVCGCAVCLLNKAGVNTSHFQLASNDA